MKVTYRLTVPPGAPGPPISASSIPPVPPMLSRPNHTAGLKAWVQDAWEKSKNPESTCWIIVTTQIKPAQTITGPTTILTAIAATLLPRCCGCCCVLVTAPPSFTFVILFSICHVRIFVKQDELLHVSTVWAPCGRKIFLAGSP